MSSLITAKERPSPFIGPAINARVKSLRNQLGLSEGAEVEIIAVNGRRGWWKRYEPAEKGDFRLATVETWVDAIRLGDGSKNKLPEGVIVEEKEEEQEKEENEEKEEKEEKEGKGEEKVEKVKEEKVEEEKVEEEKEEEEKEEKRRRGGRGERGERGGEERSP